MEAKILSETRDHVCSITINRPEKRNALDGAMFDALANAMRQAQEDPNVHCVLVKGSGAHFSAGHDIAEFGALWPQPDDGAVSRCIHSFADQTKPIVVAVIGSAVGFGATMLLHADWVIAGESSIFRFPFADLGIVPEAGSTALLARRVGDLVAREWLFSACPISVELAFRHAMVSCIKPDAEVHAGALAYAKTLAAKDPQALQATRLLLKNGSLSSAHAAIRAEMAQLNRLIPEIDRAQRA